MKRPVAGVYLRVSTEEQDYELQRDDCVRLAKARGFEPRVYAERVSAAKERPKWNELLKHARMGEVACIIVWRLDRAERSLVRTVALVDELRRWRVGLLSVKQEWCDLSDRNPVLPLIIAIMAWAAEYERDVLRERTRAGVALARKARGGQWGRPRVPAALLSLGVDRLRKEPHRTVKAVARAVGVSERSLRRALVAAKVQNTQQARRAREGTR